jgi:hypothetical protein
MSKSETHSKWTIETYVAHNEALRRADEKFHRERDRRYKEVNNEKEKSSKIQAVNEKNNLKLAREIQNYKDEKANELREQINSERLLYVRKTDLNKYDEILKPIQEFVSVHRGAQAGTDKTIYYLLIIAGLAISLIGMILFK